MTPIDPHAPATGSASDARATPRGDLLDATEAALRLGVTPGLLLAYARKARKGRTGDATTLRVAERGPEFRFAAADLDAFDAFLREPWAAPGEERPPIPDYVADYLLVESGGRCLLCPRGHRLENAHIVPFAVSRSHHHHNLAKLCEGCHGSYDGGLIDADRVLGAKAARVARLRDDLRTGASLDASWLPPSPDPLFLGRARELEAVAAALAGERSVSLEGPGGAGKTQLLLHALAATDPRAVVWLDVERTADPAELGPALQRALERGGFAPGARTLEQSLVNAPVRVVLDGIERVPGSAWDDLLDFLRALVSAPGDAQFIFTSQVELHGLPLARRIAVPPLAPVDARTLLRSAAYGADDPTSDELAAVIELCEGHPLSLRLAGALLAYHKSWATVVNRLTAGGARALREPTRRRQDRRSSLEVCLATAHDALPDGARRLLLYLAQFPAGWPTPFVDDESHGDLPWTADASAELLRWHLLVVRTDGADGVRRYRLPGPIRAFALSTAPRDRAEASRADAREALANLAMFLTSRYQGTTDIAWYMARVESDFPNYLAAFEAALRAEDAAPVGGGDPDGPRRALARLARGLGIYFFARNRAETAERVLRHGARAALKLGLADAAAELLTMLGGALARRGDVSGLLRLADEAASLAAAHPSPAVDASRALLQAWAAIESGAAEDALAQLQIAADHYSGRLAASRTSAPDAAGPATGGGPGDAPRKAWSDADGGETDVDAGMLALTEAQMGRSHEARREYAAALEVYRRALAAMEASGDELNAASTRHQIANCLADTGDEAGAWDAYLAAAQSFHRIGVEGHLSNSLAELGLLYYDWEPAEGWAETVDDELLLSGLDDVAAEWHRALPAPPARRPPWSTNAHGVRLLRKTFGLVALVNAAARMHLVRAWAVDLREGIVQPFAGADMRESLRSGSPIPPLDLGLTLVLGLVDAERATHEHGDDVDEDLWDALARFGELALMLEGLGVAWMRAPDLLAAWIRRVVGDPTVSPAVVLGWAVEDAVDAGAMSRAEGDAMLNARLGGKLADPP